MVSQLYVVKRIKEGLCTGEGRPGQMSEQLLAHRNRHLQGSSFADSARQHNGLGSHQAESRFQFPNDVLRRFRDIDYGCGGASQTEFNDFTPEGIVTNE
jgi:hypothetical protein